MVQCTTKTLFLWRNFCGAPRMRHMIMFSCATDEAFPTNVVDSHVSRSKHQRVPRFEDDGSSTVGAEVIEFLNKEADFFNEFHDRLAKADAFVRRKLETHGFVELDDEYNSFIKETSKSARALQRV
jgi:hypothetical protein